MFKDDRSEAPTPKRMDEARRKGQVARSQELVSACVLITGLIVIHTLFKKQLVQLAGLFALIWRGESLTGGSTEDWASLLLVPLSNSALMLAPLLGALCAVALGVSLMQSGFVASSYPLKPDFTRLNPVTGLARMFSMQALFTLVKSVAKVLLLGMVLFTGIRGIGPQLMALLHLAPEAAVLRLEAETYRLLLRGAVALLILGAADFAYTKYTFYQKMKMTKQEVKEEFRQSEGDPLLKAQLRARQRALARRRMTQEVPKADVVITNPTHYALALTYEPGEDKAPVVVAKGVDELALKIKLLASKHSVPIVESPVLARRLYSTTEVGDSVPEPLLALVAEVYAFVAQTSDRLRRKLQTIY